MNTGRNDLKLGLDVRVPRETVVGKKMIYYRNLGERWNTEDRGGGRGRRGQRGKRSVQVGTQSH